MPKRSNPFGDSSPLQFKTHVGVKELAMGSQQEELMKVVYDMTHEKLFSGARKNHTNDVNDNHMQSLPMPTQSLLLESASKFEPMQTLLDGTGYLIAPTRLSSPAQASKQCGEFSGWMDCGNTTSLRSQVPVSSPHSAAGQLCLDSSGQLMAPLHSAMPMDCDSEVQASSGGARGGLQNLHRFGIKSTNGTKQVPQQVKKIEVCQTCRCKPGNLRCQFCEKTVCHACVRECVACNDYFCQLCSTLNYDASTERAFCLGCLG